MSFFNKIKEKLIPEPSSLPMATSASGGGIGNGRGALDFEDNVSQHFVSLVCNASQKRVAFLSTHFT
jgi:hypothetical protein